MHFKEILLHEHSRAQMLRIVEYIAGDKERFGELLAIFLEGPYLLTQRAAWPLSYCVEKHPELLGEHLQSLLHQLETPHHNSVTRNVLRLLQFIDIPEKEAGKVMNLCFDLLTRPKEPVANKAFAMTILANLSKPYPDIKNELLLCIEGQMSNAKPGFLARAKKVKKQLVDLK